MKLWRLWRYGSVSLPCGYDEACAFVVRAASPKAARKLAAADCGDEGPDLWLDTELVGCEQLKPEGTPGVVVRDFHEA